MPFRISPRASQAARAADCGLRLELRAGPEHARPLLFDFFFEEERPRDHAEFAAEGLRIWVPVHLSWIADNDVAVEAGPDGHLFGTVRDPRTPY